MGVCPSRDELDQFSQGLLGEFEHASISAHVKECAECMKTLSALLNANTVLLDDKPSSGQANPEPAPAPAQPNGSPSNIPPELINHPRYKVLELLSIGGMGTVYKGEHKFLERYVVIKVIRGDLLGNTQHVKRFEREAKLAAQLSHPNVVMVFEAEKAGETQLLVMEFLEGKDL